MHDVHRHVFNYVSVKSLFTIAVFVEDLVIACLYIAITCIASDFESVCARYADAGTRNKCILCIRCTHEVISLISVTRSNTRNTLECDQSNYYSSRIIFSHILIECGPTRNSATSIRSADPENPILKPNTRWAGQSPT